MVLKKRSTAATSSWNSLQHPALLQQHGHSIHHDGTTTTANDDDEMICDPYKILQVRRDATHSEIRQSYRRLALLYHPGRHAVWTTSNTGSSSSTSNIVSNAVREKKKEEERARRLHMFTILAACYEVLMDKESRQQCDALLRQMEYSSNKQSRNPKQTQEQPLANESRRLKTLEEVQQQQKQQKQLQKQQQKEKQQLLKQQQQQQHPREIMPSLTAVSDASTASSSASNVAEIAVTEETPCICDNMNNREQCQFTILDCGGRGDVVEEDIDYYYDDNGVLPSLIQHSSSSSASGEMHYTEGETNRLFGGPLRLLYRTRRWQPFTDPFTVFAKVFGSKVQLGHVDATVTAMVTATSDWKIMSSPPPSTQLLLLPSSRGNTHSAAWTGTCQKLPNGTVLYTTSRVVRNRRFTRTETVRVDAHGKKHSYITVTSEELESAEGGGDKANNQDDSDMSQCCIRLELCLHYVTSSCQQPTVDYDDDDDAVIMTTTTTTTAMALPDDRDDQNHQVDTRANANTTTTTSSEASSQNWFTCWFPSCV